MFSHVEHTIELNRLASVQTKKVLIVAYYFPPCAEGGVMRVRAFAKHLPKFGWQPIVLTVQDDYYVSFTKDMALVQEFDETVKIVRTKSLEPSGKAMKDLQANIYGVKQTGSKFEKFGKPFLRYLHRMSAIPDEHILWLPSAIKTGLQLIKQFNIDVLFVTTPPHSSGVIASVLSLLSGKPLVWDVRDDWVGNPLFDVGPWHRYLAARLLEHRLVATASKIITVTEESMKAFQKKYSHQSGTKFQWIPNGFDQQEMDELRLTVQRPPNTKLRMVYIGTLGRTRTPIHLFHALEQLMNDSLFMDRFQLDIYGYSRHEFVQASNEMGLDSIVQFHGFVSREESLRQLLLADVALMIIPEEEGSQTAIPGKLYEYIGSRKFVLALCPLNSAAGRLVSTSRFGIVAPQNDSQQIQQALISIQAMYTQNHLQVGFSDNILKQFERSNHAQQLAETLTALVS